MFSQTLIHSIILALLASSAVVFSEGTATKANATSVKTNGTSGSPSGPSSGKSPSPSTNKTGSAKPKPDSPNQKVIVCATGWAPAGDQSKPSKPPTTGAPKTNTPTPGKPSNSSKTPGHQRRAESPAKAPTLDNHKSLCDTAKERYTCPTTKCKISGGKKLPEATGCKGDAQKAQCLAYRPGVKGGHISMDKHTPHPVGSHGWIECAAFHKMDLKAGRNQKIDTISCSKLSVPMECSGCELMNSTKIEKPAPPTMDPSHNGTKTDPTAKPKASAGSKVTGAAANGTKSEPAGSPSTSTGSRTNGTASNPQSSGAATKSDPNGKPKSSANGTDSSPASSSAAAPKAPKTTQPIGSQPAKTAARQ